MPNVDSGVDALDLCDRRLGDALDSVEHVIEPLFVLESILPIREGLELRDVGPGDERFAAGAAQHQDPDRVVAIDALACVDERFVHRPGHRVARLRAVEGERRDRSVGLEDRVH
jgi:hypothetical protein